MEAKQDIYLIGVGGQGIGLLSEVLLRAADHAGFPVRGVDTHGLSQRGGTVVSYVRIGPKAHSPLVQPGCADMVVALERNEAWRGLCSHLKDGGCLVYYDTEWQPLMVRLGREPRLETPVIEQECLLRGIKEVRVGPAVLRDNRMQNMVLLAAIASNKLIPGVEVNHYEQALEDLLRAESLEKNVALFREKLGLV